MKIHQIQQRTPEWFELRLQHPLTASNAQAIGNQGKGLETLCWEKVSEKYSSAERENYTNKDIDRGVELEPQALSLYELETGNTVKEVGFITNDKICKVAGASPDGLIDKDGNLEIKCFTDVKHFKLLAGEGDIESQYMWQVQMQMLIGERKWTDFVVYNPNYKQSLIIKRIEPDKVMQEKLKVGLIMGEKIISDIESKLK